MLWIYTILFSYVFSYLFLYFLVNLESKHKQFKLVPIPRFVIALMVIAPIFNCIIACTMFLSRYLELGDVDQDRMEWDRKSLNNSIFFKNETYKNEE